MKVYLLVTQYLHNSPVYESAFSPLRAAQKAAIEAADEYTVATVETFDVLD